MSEMTDLERAVSLAVRAHAGQVDKVGQPYILHPLRVMLKQSSETDRIVAVLHDVVEDSDVTIHTIRHQFGEEIALAVDALTKDKVRDGGYFDYLERVGENPIATRVKLADLEDNMDLSRFDGCELSGSVLAWREQYARAQGYLYRHLRRQQVSA